MEGWTAVLEPGRASMRARRLTRRPWRLGPGVVLGLVVALTAAGCGGKVEPSVAAGTTPPAAVSPSLNPSISPPETTTVGSWRLLPPAPFRVAPEASVWTGTQMLFFARVPNRKDGADVGGCHDVAAAYTPATRVWRKLSPPLGPTGCFEGTESAVWTGSEMLVWGAVNTAYTPATNRWRPLPDPPMAWGGPSVAAWTGKQMIGWGGGCCGDSVKDGLAYTPAAGSWEKLPPAHVSGRHAMGAWTGTELIIVGGVDADGHVFADGAAYNPTTTSWRRLPPMPEPRYGATAVWDGSEVLIAGGSGPFGRPRCAPCADGFAYSPSTNAWRRLPRMKFPRGGNVAVWTGTQMLLWGGVTDDRRETVPPHGVAYDPSDNGWSALPVAPLGGRTGAAAVWTGTSMIVWGGRLCAPDCREFTDGAAYTPAAA
jgi:hypothetical protein